MGFFKNIKDKIETMIRRAKTPRLEAGNNYKNDVNRVEDNFMYRVNLPNGNGQLLISSIDYQTKIQHSEKITNLMTVKFNHLDTRYGQIIQHRQEHLAFEIEEGQSIDDVILNKIAISYMNEKNIQNTQERKTCMYVGQLSQNPNDFSTKKSAVVNDYVNTQVSAKIELEKEQIKQQELQKEIEKANREKAEAQKFREKIHREHEKYQQEEKMKKIERLQNPFLRPNYLNNSRGFDGVNITTGDFLKLRGLDKIGKDENGTYLYTGYVQSVHDLDEAEYLGTQGKHLGVPVCFASDKKIEDIINSENPNELIGILSLLSNEEHFKNNNGYLNYIGKVDKFGKNDKNFANVSKTIQSEVNKLQKQFFEEKKSNIKQNDNEKEI